MVCSATGWLLPIGTLPACGEEEEGERMEPNCQIVNQGGSKRGAYHDRSGRAPLGGMHTLTVLEVQVYGRDSHGLGTDLRRGAGGKGGKAGAGRSAACDYAYTVTLHTQQAKTTTRKLVLFQGPTLSAHLLTPGRARPTREANALRV